MLIIRKIIVRFKFLLNLLYTIKTLFMKFFYLFFSLFFFFVVEGQSQRLECVIDLDYNYERVYSAHPVTGNPGYFRLNWNVDYAIYACRLNSFLDIKTNYSTSECQDITTSVINVSYPININSNGSIDIDFLNLTTTPYPAASVPIFGSKCFWWRLRVIGRSCNTNEPCETVSEWSCFCW